MTRHEVDFAWLSYAMSSRPQTLAGKSGKISVEHAVLPAGTLLPVISHRNAIFMHQQPTSVRFNEDVIYRSLKSETHGTWMADSAQEVYQCRDAIQAVAELGRCRMLIGGLGLGVYSALAMKMTDADVTTIERERDVIKLVRWGVMSPRHKLAQGCIYKNAAVLKQGYYDVALLDVWQATGEFAWLREVIPLRRLVRPKVEKVFCWNEEEMIGQYRMGAYRKLLLGVDGLPSGDNHYRAVRLAMDDEGLDIKTLGSDDMTVENMPAVFKMEHENSQRPEVIEIVEAFATDIGSPQWEERFGDHWDRAVSLGKKRDAQDRRRWSRKRLTKQAESAQ